jgi:Ca2+-transporting ATPase
MVQILRINLLTDRIPALALAFDRTPGVMGQPPRPASSPLLDRPSIRCVVGMGSLKAALALSLLGVLPLSGIRSTSRERPCFTSRRLVS